MLFFKVTTNGHKPKLYYSMKKYRKKQYLDPSFHLRWMDLDADKLSKTSCSSTCRGNGQAKHVQNKKCLSTQQEGLPIQIVLLQTRTRILQNEVDFGNCWTRSGTILSTAKTPTFCNHSNWSVALNEFSSIPFERSSPELTNIFQFYPILILFETEQAAWATSFILKYSAFFEFLFFSLLFFWRRLGSY